MENDTQEVVIPVLISIICTTARMLLKCTVAALCNSQRHILHRLSHVALMWIRTTKGKVKNGMVHFRGIK